MSLKTKSFICLLIIIVLNLVSTIYAIDNQEYEYIYKKTNILLIGDNKEGNTPYNFFIVLTVDGNNQKLTLTTLRRNTKLKKRSDTLYDVYSKQDKNYLKKVIKDNYNIEIDYYIVMNKTAFQRIVDTTNTIKIKDRRVHGYQVLNYMENTYNCDICYQEKIQREVIQELMYGLSVLPFSQYPYVIQECYPYVKIDMCKFKMLCLGFTALSFKNYEANQYVLY